MGRSSTAADSRRITGSPAAYAPGKSVSPGVTAPADEAEAAIVSAVLYAALFTYPLTLPELRAATMHPIPSIDVLRSRLQSSAYLRRHLTVIDDLVVPRGRTAWLDVRRRRERHSRAMLHRHAWVLRVIASLPFVRGVAISGSLAHLNAEASGDLDLFLVARDRQLWTVAVLVIAVARLLGQRRTICANFIVGTSSLTCVPEDAFTARELLALRPVEGAHLRAQVISANPSVRTWFPNVEPQSAFPVLDGAWRGLRRSAEWCLTPVRRPLERLCRYVYRRHLQRKRHSWESPDQVYLGDDQIKLHTRSHRPHVLEAHARLLAQAGLSRWSPVQGDVSPGSNSGRVG